MCITWFHKKNLVKYHRLKSLPTLNTHSLTTPEMLTKRFKALTDTYCSRFHLTYYANSIVK